MKNLKGLFGISLVGLALALGSSSLAACGDDDDDNGGTGGKSGSGGTGGSSGKGTGGSAGSGTGGSAGSGTGGSAGSGTGGSAGSGTGGSAGSAGAGGSAGSAGNAGSAGSAGGGSVPDISGTFVLACTNELFGKIEQAIRFRGTNSMTVSGTGGELEIAVQPIKSKATTANDLSGTETKADAKAQVNDKGETVLTFAKIEVPGDANPSTNNDVTLTNAAFREVIVSADEVCLRFRATVNGLINLSYDNDANACIGKRLASPDATLPAITQAELDNCKTLVSDTPP